MDKSVLTESFAFKHADSTVSAFLGVLSVSLLSLWAFQHRQNAPRNPPPGPLGVPVLGILPFLGKAAYRTFTTMAEKYGAVFQVYMGSRRTIVVNGVKAARQVLVVQSDDFAGRPDFESFKYIAQGKSMAFGQYGPRVKLHKKIARSAMRQFTANPSSPIENQIWHEGKLLIQDLLSHDEKPSPVGMPIRLSVASVIYGLCFGPSDSIREDQDFLFFLKTQDKFTDLQRAGGNPADLLPWLSVFLQGKLKEFIAISDHFQRLLKVQKGEHIETYQREKLRDVMDALIKASNEHDPAEMEAVGLTKEHLLNTVTELIGAGQNTVSATLAWLVLYMVTFPEIQDKVQQEIDEVLGGELPQPTDRARMPYAMACLYEAWRFSAQVPFLIPHSTTCDTTLYGYDIPRDTLVFVNMWSVCRDPDTWHNPHVFDPTRFLDDLGDLDKCQAENVFAFGGGKRRCLGEYLARHESFIFFVMLFQKLRFEKVEGVEYDLTGHFGLSLEPHDYEYVIKERKA